MNNTFGDIIEMSNNRGSETSEEEGDEIEVEEDEVVWEQRRKDKDAYLEQMADIEKEYTEVKRQLFQKRLDRIDAALSRLKQGQLKRFRKQQRIAERQRRQQVKITTIRKNFKLSSLRNFLEANRRSARDNFEERSRALKAQMIASLRSELKQAEKDKMTMDTQPLPPEPTPPPRSSSGSRNYLGQKASKKAQQVVEPSMMMSNQRLEAHLKKHRKQHQPFVVRNPYVVYNLGDGDVLADLRILNKGINKKPIDYSKDYMSHGRSQMY